MTRLAVTGATGHLGRLTIRHLLERGVPAAEVVAVVRDREKAADLADAGVTVRVADYTDPEALEAAFAGVERVLLVSGSVPGERVQQHRNVIDAAVRAGVRHVAYTSLLRADVTTVALRDDHVATEAMLSAAGLGVTLLRNGWYAENYVPGVAAAVEHGVLAGASGDGRIAAATRSDYAAAAAAVLAEGEVHEGATYELAGDQSFGLDELAAWIADGAGTPVAALHQTEDEFRQTLEAAGLPAPVAAMFAAIDTSIAAGELDGAADDLRRLVGRPLERVDGVIRSAAANVAAPAQA